MSPVTRVETIVDLRIASGSVPQGQFKIVKGNIDGSPDYAIFADDEYIGSFEAATEQEAVCEGLTKIRELLEHLRMDRKPNFIGRKPDLTISYADIVGDHTAQAVQVIVDKVETADLEQAIQEMPHGLWVKTDGTVNQVQPNNGSTFTLEEMQSFVAGSIEYVPFASDLHMYVNNDGVPEPGYEGLPLNAKATAFLWKHQPWNREQRAGLHGDVFNVRPEDEDEE